MDRGIWATWYDLPEEGKDEYVSWLHEIHIPKALSRPGYLWSAHIENIWDEAHEAHKAKVLTWTDDPAVPTGNDYLLLFGAELVLVLDGVNAEATDLDGGAGGQARRAGGYLRAIDPGVFHEDA